MGGLCNIWRTTLSDRLSNFLLCSKSFRRRVHGEPLSSFHMRRNTFPIPRKAWERLSCQGLKLRKGNTTAKVSGSNWSCFDQTLSNSISMNKSDTQKSWRFHSMDINLGSITTCVEFSLFNLARLNCSTASNTPAGGGVQM